MPRRTGPTMPPNRDSGCGATDTFAAADRPRASECFGAKAGFGAVCGFGAFDRRGAEAADPAAGDLALDFGAGLLAFLSVFRAMIPSERHFARFRVARGRAGR